jgi:SAM-dependent methyltransferase
MTAIQRLTKKIPVRLVADGQRIWRASAAVRPLSTDAMAIRLRKQAELLGDYLRPGNSILDVGCGPGYICQFLQEMYGVEPTGVDVKDFRVAQIPFREFDGISIPFLDQSFDHVILSFTLHHSHDPQALIEECHRVARRSLLVFEDLPDTRLGKAMVFVHVQAFQRFFRLQVPKGVDYRAALGWLADKAVNVTRVPMPAKGFDRLYSVPRFLVVYTLSED